MSCSVSKLCKKQFPESYKVSGDSLTSPAMCNLSHVLAAFHASIHSPLQVKIYAFFLPLGSAHCCLLEGILLAITAVAPLIPQEDHNVCTTWHSSSCGESEESLDSVCSPLGIAGLLLLSSEQLTSCASVSFPHHASEPIYSL